MAASSTDHDAVEIADGRLRDGTVLESGRQRRMGRRRMDEERGADGPMVVSKGLGACWGEHYSAQHRLGDGGTQSRCGQNNAANTCPGERMSIVRVNYLLAEPESLRLARLMIKHHAAKRGQRADISARQAKHTHGGKDHAGRRGRGCDDVRDAESMSWRCFSCLALRFWTGMISLEIARGRKRYPGSGWVVVSHANWWLAGNPGARDARHQEGKDRGYDQ